LQLPGDLALLVPGDLDFVLPGSGATTRWGGVKIRGGSGDSRGSQVVVDGLFIANPRDKPAVISANHTSLNKSKALILMSWTVQILRI
jgi:hypothetical protein